MLAGMDTRVINRTSPGGRGRRPASSVLLFIVITLAVIFTIAGLAVVAGTVLLYYGLSHYGSNK
jgi:hypothetical protein